jgi:cysteine-rich repeat protein
VAAAVSEHACVEAHSHHARDYIAVNDPTCQGLGCLPEDAPCDPLVPCCGGGVCTNGVCTNLCEGVTCTPSDSCHDAGVCDPQTGICSNPAKGDGAQCDDGNACTQSDVCASGACGGAAYSCPPASEECHVGACNGDGTCSEVDAPDGTTCCGPIPSGLCGSEFHGSCQAGACANLNACGDGFIELALGESCDDGNTVDGDGCDATCHVEPFETTAPVKISGDLACTTAVANAARKIAVDGSGTIYAVMRCGASANVAVSTDRGQSFSAPRADLRLRHPARQSRQLDAPVPDPEQCANHLFVGRRLAFGVGVADAVGRGRRSRQRVRRLAAQRRRRPARSPRHRRRGLR